jgi:hypothetical protein
MIGIWVLMLVGCHTPQTLDAAPATPRVVLAAPTSPSIDPGTAPSPYDTLLPVPQLASRGSDFDLELLGYRYTVYRIKADFSALASVRSTDTAVVHRHLAADPRWRVGVWDGAVVAFQRTGGHAGGWTVPRHGYHMASDSIWRTGIRFSPWSVRSPWASDELVTRVPATQTLLNLRAFELAEGPGAGMRTTALTVEGRALSVDVFEATTGTNIDVTATALYDVPRTVAGICAQREAVQKRGFNPLVMPHTEPATQTQPHVGISSPGAGLLEVKGRINPRRPGWTWLRIVDERRRSWETTAVAAGTREAVGWSPDPETQFYFQSQFAVSPGRPFPATAEVWFAANDTQRAERLAAFPVTVPQR